MTANELLQLRLGRQPGRMYYSQRELADVLGVAANTVARWERGERPIPRWVDCSLAYWQEVDKLEGKLARIDMYAEVRREKARQRRQARRQS